MQIAAGLDAGSSDVRCVVYALEDGSLRFLGAGEAPSTGWYKGRLADPEALTMSVLSAVDEAGRQAQVPLESVVVGVGGPTINSFNSHWTYDFGRPREIGADELQFAVKQASDVKLQHDRMILHVCPQDFNVDGRAHFHYPRGATCTRLEANVHLITTSTQETHGLVSAVHQAHLAVEETVLEPLAAAYAAVLPEDRAHGVAVLDIGAHSTDAVVYIGDAMALAFSVRICGELFTRDVAWGFKVSHDAAEDLKRQFGSAILGLTGNNSTIVLPSTDGRGYREAPCRELNTYLDARAEDLFYMVGKKFQDYNLLESLAEGVVLCGGGAMLDGMCDMAERVLNCPARKGLTVGVKDFPEQCDNPAWTTAGGLAMYAARLKMRKQKRRRAPGPLGLVFR